MTDIRSHYYGDNCKPPHVPPEPELPYAYNGDAEPPKRELTARERDILCRVINEILTHKKDSVPVWNDDPPFPGYNWTPVPISIGEPGFFHTLWKIREAIDPRKGE